jgi:hypothetical protein
MLEAISRQPDFAVAMSLACYYHNCSAADLESGLSHQTTPLRR